MFGKILKSSSALILLIFAAPSFCFTSDPHNFASRKYYSIQAYSDNFGLRASSSPEEVCEKQRIAVNAAGGYFGSPYIGPLKLVDSGPDAEKIVVPGGSTGFEDQRMLGAGSRYGCFYPLEKDPKTPLALVNVKTNYCGVYEIPDIGGSRCIRVVDRYHDNDDCPCEVGNPILPITGTKIESINLGQWLGRDFNFSLKYSTREKSPGDHAIGVRARDLKMFGNLWGSSVEKGIVSQNNAIQMVRGHDFVTFYRGGSEGQFLPDANVKGRLVGLNLAWRYIDADALAVEDYVKVGNTVGLLASVSSATGGRLDYVYSDSLTPANVAPLSGLIIEIKNHFGRSVHFEYELSGTEGSPRVARIIDALGGIASFQYDSFGNLDHVVWPDSAVKQYVYEDLLHSWALTGIVDENGARHSTYRYDSEGRAVSTELAGGVNNYAVTYDSSPVRKMVSTYDSVAGRLLRDYYWQAPAGISLSNPTGVTQISLDNNLTIGAPRVQSRTQLAGSGASLSLSSMSYDANGNLTQEDDFNGHRTCKTYDLNRNLVNIRVEGLANTQACIDVTAQGSALPVGARKISIQWHPDWTLEVQRAEPLKITTFVYNGQPDPFSSNQIANCAPANALLPDGKPIVALCKKVEQATTDMDGRTGPSASLDTSVPMRVFSYTYNQYGQVLVAIDPLQRQTVYSYYADTNDVHRQGDLQSVSNAAGNITTYDEYDRAGRILKTTAPNGIVTRASYYPRGWVKSIGLASADGDLAQETTYQYFPTGLLKTVTQPDQTVVNYSYDDAHRLIGVSDAAGNSVTYTLDASGNRIGEQVKDGSGRLVNNVTRIFDALNRLQTSIGAPN